MGQVGFAAAVCGRCVPLHHLLRLRHDRDAFQLDRDGGGQGGDAEGGAAGLGVAEVFAVDAVVGRKITLHIGQEHGDIEQILPACAAGFEHGADIGEHLVALGLDVVIDERAAGIVHVARNRVVPRIARADAGQEEEIADPARVRIRTDRLGCAFGVDDVVHGRGLFMPTTIDCRWWMTLERSRARISYLPGRNQSSAIGYGSVLLRRMSP